MTSSWEKEITFLLVLEEKIPEPNFSLKNLPGSSKIDVVARTILATFPHFGNITVKYVVLFTKNKPATLTVTNLVNREKPYDEIEIASLIKSSLNQHLSSESNSTSSIPFFEWQEVKDLNTFFIEMKETYDSIFYLHEKGDPFTDIIPKLQNDTSCLFIFGGRYDISKEVENLIQKIVTSRVSLGSRSYLASTCITFVLFELEKLEKN